MAVRGPRRAARPNLPGTMAMKSGRSSFLSAFLPRVAVLQDGGATRACPHAERRTNRQHTHAPTPANPRRYRRQEIDRRGGEQKAETRLQGESGAHVLAWGELTDSGRELGGVCHDADSPHQ